MSFCYASFLAENSLVNWHLHGKVPAIADWFLDDVPVESLGHTICYYHCHSFIQVPSPNQKTASNSKKNSEITTTKKKTPSEKGVCQVSRKKIHLLSVIQFLNNLLTGTHHDVFCWWICKDILRKSILTLTPKRLQSVDVGTEKHMFISFYIQETHPPTMKDTHPKATILATQSPTFFELWKIPQPWPADIFKKIGGIFSFLGLVKIRMYNSRVSIDQKVAFPHAEWWVGVQCFGSSYWNLQWKEVTVCGLKPPT